MFRPMAKPRAHQQIPEEECIRILKEQKRGILCVLGDDDYPYGTPTNHFYCEEDGSYCYYDAAQGGIIIINSDQLDLTSGGDVVYQSEHLILKMSNNIPTVTKTEEDERLVD